MGVAKRASARCAGVELGVLMEGSGAVRGLVAVLRVIEGMVRVVKEARSSLSGVCGGAWGCAADDDEEEEEDGISVVGRECIFMLYYMDRFRFWRS